MDRSASDSSFAEAVRSELAKLGLGDAELVFVAPESPAFGNTAAVFSIGPLLLRVTSERGQQFVDIASQAEPTKFHQFDDVDIALGWRSVDDVLAKSDPEPVGSVLLRVKDHLNALSEAFSGGRERFTRARVEKAARERGEAFTARLRGKPRSPSDADR